MPVLHLLHLVTWPQVPLKGSGHTFVQLGLTVAPTREEETPGLGATPPPAFLPPHPD